MTSVDLAVFSTGWLLGWLLLWRTRPLPTVAQPEREPIAAIIPARNEARSIGAVVDRIVAQLRPGDELVVVDDQSDDDTAVLARGGGARVVPTATGVGLARQAARLLARSPRHRGADTAVHRRRRAPIDTAPRRHRGRRPGASRRGGVGATLAPHRALVRAGQPAVQRDRPDGIGRVHRARRACPSDRGVRARARDAPPPLRRGRRARGRPRSTHRGHRSRPTGRWRRAVHRATRHDVSDVSRRLAATRGRLDAHHRDRVSVRPGGGWRSGSSGGSRRSPAAGSQAACRGTIRCAPESSTSCARSSAGCSDDGPGRSTR